MATADRHISDLPAVSVVVPTYQQPGFLQTTLEAVFAQTWQDFEVVVVDDGSADDTPAVLERLSQRYGGRLRVVRQANGGIGAARNRGIDEARGRYVALLDHDDLWMPTKLAEQVAFMEGHPACVACVVPFAEFADDADPVGRPAFDVDAVAGAGGVIDRPLRKLSENHGFMTTSSVLMFDRRRAQGLRYAVARGAVEDVPFYIKLFARGGVGVAGRRVLARYRVHGAGGSARAGYYYRGLLNLRSLDRQGHFAEFAGQDRDDLEAYLAYLGRLCCVNQVTRGDRKRGAVLFVRELRHQVRQRRYRFLLGFVPLLLSPRPWFARRWKGRASAG